MLTVVAERGVDVTAYLAECRRLAIEDIRRFVPTDDACGPILYDLMLEYPLRDAKGLRPALCIATSRALGGGLEAVLPSAAILELYHNAFLIHDDVEDGSEQRRDRPTLHREYGVPIAINVGDGMLALALGPLLDNTRIVGLGKALRIMQTIARMARETAEGQAIELGWIRSGRWDIDDDDYRRMVVKKTGWYSFIAPVTIGALIAGATDAGIETLAEMAHELSIAFQIRDDVLNMSATGPYGKEAHGDLWEGKRTLIVLHMMRALEPAARREAVAMFARTRPGTRREGDAGVKTEADVAQLAAWIAQHGSLEYASALGEAHAIRARAALERAALRPSVHHELLHALVDFTIAREH